MRPKLSPEGAPDGVVQHVSPDGFATSYVAEPNSIPRARRALRAFAEAGGATAEQLDDIALASSEAITNVVRHAYIGTKGEIHVRARVTPRRLCIVVTDDGLGLHHTAPNPGLGRGLDVVRHVSDAMTLEDRPGGGVKLSMCFVLAAAG
jgi:serine/threonine-protein kinase RsbW